MITPVLKDDAFLADVKRAGEESDALHLWWLGQSGFLVQWKGNHLLLDPYLSNSLTEKYADTDKPHVRMTERIVDPARLDFIDVVTSSHNDTDHLDAETLVPILRSSLATQLVIPEANRMFVQERLRCDPFLPIGIDDGERIRVGPITIIAVPAAHNEVERDEDGRCTHLGYVIYAGPWTLYHSGDTMLYKGMAEQLTPHDIDVALLPINGNRPERGVSGSLWGREAAQLAKTIHAGVVIPCHYDMFEYNTETPQEFTESCRKLDQECAVLQCGQRWGLETAPEQEEEEQQPDGSLN